MIDWSIVYQRLMHDFKTEALLSHLSLIGGSFALGLLLSIFVFGSFQLVFLFLVIGISLDYLLFSKDWVIIFTKKPPYVFRGFVRKKIRKGNKVLGKGKEKFFFIMEIREANILDKDNKNPLDYQSKLGQQRLEVPESMYLSLQVRDGLEAVCNPFDEVWGIVKGEEVIEIEY